MTSGLTTTYLPTYLPDESRYRHLYLRSSSRFEFDLRGVYRAGGLVYLFFFLSHSVVYYIFSYGLYSTTKMTMMIHNQHQSRL